jgi:putative phosphoribosyl transferase
METTTQGGLSVTEQEVYIPLQPFHLEGVLAMPPEAKGVVLFAHGSGSSRFSPRNRAVADALNQVHLGTLLLDLLTPDEGEVDERTRALRFDIDLLAGRLVVAIDWLRQERWTHQQPIGLFGASTGAAAALVAASERAREVRAVVSRGGRPDLAGMALRSVHAPTLFIVGSRDEVVLALNRQALQQLPMAEKRLMIVPGAGHMFEERGALETVGQLAAEWFNDYVRSAD